MFPFDSSDLLIPSVEKQQNTIFTKAMYQGLLGLLHTTMRLLG